MKYGLTEQEIQVLNKKIIQPLKKYKAQVYLFGSRANGKFKKFSDIDILYVSKESCPVPASVISQIIIDIEDSEFAYKVDLVSSKELAKSYEENVNREKIEL